MGTIPDSTAVLERPPAIIPSNDDPGTITEFHITGFGPFHNISVNPTQGVVEALPTRLKLRPLQKGCVVASTSVLEVSGKTTREKIQSMYKKLDKPTHPALVGRSRKERRVVFIHLGLNVRVTNFQLEIQGRNEATFSCPDQRGWAPVKRPIDESNPNIDSVCRTTLRLDDIVNDLSKRGHDLEVSTDAGRFVCNWLYFNSLQLAEKCSAHSLFVHVPPASVIPVEQQAEFVCELLECISRLC